MRLSLIYSEPATSAIARYLLRATAAFCLLLAISWGASAQTEVSEPDPGVKPDPEVVKQLEREYQERFEEEAKKVDQSFLIKNPIENQVAPLTASCQKTLISIYSACSAVPLTARCEGLMQRFQGNCVVPPPPKKEAKKKKAKEGE